MSKGRDHRIWSPIPSIWRASSTFSSVPGDRPDENPTVGVDWPTLKCRAAMLSLGDRQPAIGGSRLLFQRAAGDRVGTLDAGRVGTAGDGRIGAYRFGCQLDCLVGGKDAPLAGTDDELLFYRGEYRPKRVETFRTLAGPDPDRFAIRARRPANEGASSCCNLGQVQQRHPSEADPHQNDGSPLGDECPQRSIHIALGLGPDQPGRERADGAELTTGSATTNTICSGRHVSRERAQPRGHLDPIAVEGADGKRRLVDGRLLRRVVDPVPGGTIVEGCPETEQVRCHRRGEHGRARRQRTVDDRRWTLRQPTERTNRHMDLDRPPSQTQLANGDRNLVGINHRVHHAIQSTRTPLMPLRRSGAPLAHSLIAVAEPDLGPWSPFGLDALIQRFSSAQFHWWISGGHALELHLGRSWREHDDIDVRIVPDEVHLLRDLLSDWDLHIAASGRLTPWHGEPLDAERHQNNIWCRLTPAEPWALDVLISDGSATGWIYRRDPSVRVPWEQAIVHTTSGVPYLAPELQLLFKSQSPRAKDDLDAREVALDLEDERRARLSRFLSAEHPWQDLLH